MSDLQRLAAAHLWSVHHWGLTAKKVDGPEHLAVGAHRGHPRPDRPSASWPSPRVGAMTALGENPLGHEVSQLGVVTPPTPARQWCPNNGPRPGWLPPDKFHCAQDHYLQATYGINCDAYWHLSEHQGGRCAVCGQPPGTRRLVVDHDHDTGRIDGLCHFGCNRRLHSQVRRYLNAPPGRMLGLRVAPAQFRKLKAKDQAKRTRPRPAPTQSSTNGFHERTQTALEATRQGG